MGTSTAAQRKAIAKYYRTKGWRIKSLKVLPEVHANITKLAEHLNCTKGQAVKISVDNEILRRNLFDDTQ